ncbi:MAG: NAD(P)H-dependent glycerol-3-phosphate dehydrogenase, partial [Candidatus Hydrogenedentes bacterium]|nr:NAD(P)H-dependent glycerol-3-phosphate dehydrogenase [Candidatus Hydrogenedentota bacterium]
MFWREDLGRFLMRVQVIGSGSFGIALARLLARNGHGVALWCKDNAAVLREKREDPAYLPGVVLPGVVEILDEGDELAADAELAVLAVPSHAMRSVLGAVRLPDGAIRVSVAKGIENNTLMRMSEVIAETAPGGAVVALSGPSHAEEVARDLPASVVVASADAGACARVQEMFLCKTFRVYTSPDVIGVELGGSLKNVIAIAAGVCDGFGLGDNAKAALMTRGLAEITRLGVACG